MGFAESAGGAPAGVVEPKPPNNGFAGVAWVDVFGLVPVDGGNSDFPAFAKRPPAGAVVVELAVDAWVVLPPPKRPPPAVDDAVLLPPNNPPLGVLAAAGVGVLVLPPNIPPAAGVLLAPPNKPPPELAPAAWPPNKELPVAGVPDVFAVAPPKRLGVCAPLLGAAFPNKPPPLD